jgi:hypothetical protein
MPVFGFFFVAADPADALEAENCLSVVPTETRE